MPSIFAYLGGGPVTELATVRRRWVLMHIWMLRIVSLNDLATIILALARTSKTVLNDCVLIRQLVVVNEDRRRFALQLNLPAPAFVVPVPCDESDSD